MDLVKIEYKESIYSPYSGIPITNDEGHDESDETLLLVYYGDAGLIAYVSDKLADQVDEDDDEDIDEIIARLNIPNGIALCVDTHENGINYYVFGPSGS